GRGDSGAEESGGRVEGVGQCIRGRTEMTSVMKTRRMSGRDAALRRHRPRTADGSPASVQFSTEQVAKIRSEERNHSMKNIALALCFIVLALAVAVESARAQGTAFTYQGELTYSGALANGVFDLQFTIYAASSGGSALAGPLTRNAVTISNGVFTVLLDFGAGVFSGADRWVEIGARTNGGTFSTLAPRQPLTPAPYAITAANVASGGIPAGTYASPVTFNNTSNSFSGSFTGSGAALTGLNGGGLAPGSVSNSALANGAVTASKIASGQAVKSLNGLNDAVTLSAGANITLTPSGNNIQIAASGGGGSGGWSLTGN